MRFESQETGDMIQMKGGGAKIITLLSQKKWHVNQSYKRALRRKQAQFIKAVFLNFLQTTSDIYHQNMLLYGCKTSYKRFLQQNCKKSIAN